VTPAISVRADVRMLVARDSGLRHAYFGDLTRFLQPGDLIVVNNSGTMPAAVEGCRGSSPVTVHFSTQLDDGCWVVEIQPAAPDATVGDRVNLPIGELVLVGPYVPGRLWRATVSVDVRSMLARYGRPIKYRGTDGRWSIEDYQTVFACDQGSAEMPSAGRPFSAELVTRLVAADVSVAPITLHTGVSALVEGDPPLPERFHVPECTARLVNLVRATGGKVVAVGTTATRALESVASEDGTVTGATGWTDLVLGPDRPVRVVNGLVTGWHAPGASHLRLLQAVAGKDLVARAYKAAESSVYLWDDFGDSCLLLPDER
jgi:S-adenosylmethionine:tRNA ribosyltransferase-isomerase